MTADARHSASRSPRPRCAKVEQAQEPARDRREQPRLHRAACRRRGRHHRRAGRGRPGAGAGPGHGEARPHRRARDPGRRARAPAEGGARGEPGARFELWSDAGHRYRRQAARALAQRRSDDPHLSGALHRGRAAAVHRHRHDRLADASRPDAEPLAEVPLSAIFQQGTQPAVWVVDKATGTVALRPVTISRWRDETALIASGVKDGEIVATAGVHKLEPGQKVKPLQPARRAEMSACARTNLSALALKNSTLTLFFMLVLTAAGVFAYFSLGRAEDPPFTIKQMVVSAAWPGATAREMEQQVTDKLETKLQELPYFYNVQSYTKPGETVIYVSLRDDVPPAKVPDLWYQVRKKIGDIKGTLPQGVLGPVLQRRVRRHLQPDLGVRGRRLLRRRGEGDGQGGAPAAAARARRHQGRPVRRAGREDLHRVQPRAARHAGHAGRPDPRRRAQAERDRRRPARSRPRASAWRSASTARRPRPSS